MLSSSSTFYRAIFCIIIAQLSLVNTYLNAQAPEITIFLIIDQFAYHELIRARSSLIGGIKFLCNNGIFYTAASAGNGFPETAPGHTGIATGSFAKDHGIVANTWFDKSTNQIIQCDDDINPASSVLSLTGNKHYGKSPHNLQVDTLSDQFIINASANTSYEVYSISLKSRASILTSGRLGKPIWFDSEQAIFTSSKAYFDKLPDWLINWNNAHEPLLKSISLSSVNTVTNGISDILTLDLALNYLNLCYLSSPKTDSKAKKMVLWLNLSTLDYIGHALGPGSFVTYNYLTRLDKILAYFISAVNSFIDPQKILWVLTADHGVMPVPEKLPGKFTLAHRIDAKSFIESCNTFLSTNYSITNLVKMCDGFSLYLDEKKLSHYNHETQNKILRSLKDHVQIQPGIRQAWTFEELQNTPIPADDVRMLIKNQLYRERSGQLIYLVHPYTLIQDSALSGTAHQTPYDYDTHIPLVIYQKGLLERQTISTQVYAQQIAPTIAQIHGVPKPSASTLPILPMTIKNRNNGN